MNIKTISESISKAYRQVPIAISDIKVFRTAINTFYLSLSNYGKEGNLETYLRDFLRSTFYSNNDINKPDDSDIDWAVRLGDKDTPIGIIIENKKPSNKSEMITKDNLNKKAMQELVYYYLEERLNGNTDIRYLIANNMYEFFFFDAREFERCFYDNKELIREYKDFKNNAKTNNTTDKFYKEIASKYIHQVQENIFFTYIDLQTYKNAIISDDDSKLKSLVPLYRIFSDIHLLKRSFQNDNNTLNDAFYKELLYILGLREAKIDNKVKIVRNPNGERYKASLLENAINKMDAEDSLNNISDINSYGNSLDEQYFNVALQLCITWINRILFLKLLEAQLIRYNHGDKLYKFLTIEKISDFDELNRLFFQVLARNYNERGEDEIRDFPNVPYLNSSLFEVTDLERNTIKISGLSQKDMMPLLTNSVLKKDEKYRRKEELPALEYLLAFLDAYNFAYDSEDEIQETPKTLISASVLGLIFEKINGHKDGAIYTPSQITMYMSREAIRRTVVQKFNDKYQWMCKDFTALKNRELDIPEANGIIDELKICDPAVGSGHFLVSVLNELIQIKYDLGILVDKRGERILRTDYTFCIENDELVVTDAKNDLFIYNKDNKESRRIQETLFDEKRKLIENCLYGVDLNPNSVNICQLRLWIELLKHSYYTEESNYKYLETLPNIDINIKCGNSLLMKHTLQDDIRQILANTNLTITKYQDDVKKYKRTSSKNDKKIVEKDIEIIKSAIKKGLDENSKLVKEWKKEELALNMLKYNLSLFADSNKKYEKEIQIKEKRVVELRKLIEEQKQNPIYNEAFEWRYEFPEILSAKGNFEGFDCIIGNPPYGVSIKGDYRKKIDAQWGHVPDYEIYYYFIQLSEKILKEGGYMAYIIPNTWLFNTFAQNYRQTMLNHWSIKELLDCTNFNIFDSVTVRNSILTMQKSKDGCNCVGYRKTEDAMSFDELIKEELKSINKDDLLLMNQNWALAFSRKPEVITLVNRIASCTETISSHFAISQGYIPYRQSDLIKVYGESEGKRIVKERLWHSTYPKDETYLQELYGRDITKYDYHSTGQYVKYGKHLACYVDLKFFTSYRLLVREITNPQIIACLVDKTYVNDPQLICVIEKSNENIWNLQILWSILNSKLATFYHFNHSPKATKGAFPKILVQDIQQFPLPVLRNEEAGKIKNIVAGIMASKMKSSDADTSESEKQIDEIVYHLYGLTYKEVLLVDPNTTITYDNYCYQINKY